MAFFTRDGSAWVPQYLTKINPAKCIGCGRCYKVCSRDVMHLHGVDEDGKVLGAVTEDDDDDFDGELNRKIMIVDNAGGHLMQHGQVDMVIVGTDRTTARGDVCNKIGTYLKALAARDNDVPFYVALPSPTIDWTVQDGVAEIPIEERDAEEVTHVQGKTEDGRTVRVRISPEGTPGANPAFDVTPARLITGLITERGIADASAQGLKAMFADLS